ncbi:dimethylglycine dehydrogenase [Verticillium alfalfae VaMs.102]|uniref:Dimethylglycine dehydrogenase n=1 Tax=Verticillium alfalfae (strain VaMs.102 / ATCC MYA-4576 / FGSC 10136) TaxID=526221 RepID=C9SNP1_VERA1|nr:dimethylglycine dehydrogenase [Verticillium alfalfae VaMs.102]EEY20406.1 dimethylglycine dehydrogenase [Verticillium alfalfae VaMs.102]
MSETGLPPYRAKTATVAQIPVTVMNVSFVGEPGCEIHTTAEHGQRLWDLLWHAGQAHGVVAAGRAALNALRLEAGFRSYGADVTTEHNPLEAGLALAVDADKTGYVGYEALRRLSTVKPSRRLRCFTVDDGQSVVLGKEPVYAGGKVAGYVTNAAFGFTVRKPIAYGYLPIEVNVGDGVEIEYFGRRIKATVVAEPLHQQGTIRTEIGLQRDEQAQPVLRSRL